jgi:HPt (histidine-containing phosphotransfer) domain-containing protein
LSLHSLQVIEGIRRIGGKEIAYRKQLKRFREHYANAIDQLQRLLQADNLVQAENYCHSLKGVAGNIGANTLYRAIAAVDTLLKQQELPAAEQIRELHDLLQQVMTDIDSLSPPPAPSAIVAERLSPEAVAAKIAQLTTALESDLGAADALLTDLRQGTADSNLEADIAVIAAEIDAFNIDQALALLAALQQRITASTSFN